MNEEQRLKHCERLRQYYARNRERFKQWRVEKREENAAYQRAYYAQVPDEVKAAWWTLSKAVQRGKITKPDRCQSCDTVGPVEGHHYKGYAKEHRLTVQWLCKPCHAVEGHGRPYRSRKDVVAKPTEGQPGKRPFGLTVRQFQIATLIVQGLNRDEVTRALGIARQTSNVHYDHLFKRMGVHTTEELIAKWIAGGG